MSQWLIFSFGDKDKWSYIFTPPPPDATMMWTGILFYHVT